MNLFDEVKIIINVILVSFLLLLITINIYEAVETSTLEKNERNFLLEQEEYLNRKKIEDSILQESILKEEMTIEEKFEANLKLDVLYITEDEINRYNEYVGQPTWIEEINEEIQFITNQKVNYRYISLNGASIMWGWQLFRQLPEDEKYDLIILEGIDKGGDSIGPEYFKMIYETLIVDLLTDYSNDSIAILKNISNHESKYTELVEGVSTEYEINIIDYDSSKNFADTVIKSVRDYSRNEFRLVADVRLIDEDLDIVEGFMFKVPAATYSGFEKKADVLVSYNTNSFLQYEVKYEYYIVTYAVHPDGSELLVYLDDKHKMTIDTKSDVVHTKTLFIPTEGRSVMTVVTDSAQTESGVILNVSGIE